MIIWNAYCILVGMVSFVPYSIITFFITLWVCIKRDISFSKAIDVVNDEYEYDHELVMHLIFWFIAFLYYKK